MTSKSPINLIQSLNPLPIALVTGEGKFATRAISLQTFAPGEVFAKITGTLSAPARTYATVQNSKTTDIELNSDLVYINHSCDPNLIFDMTRLEVRVAPHKNIYLGDELTWFYPSTEWDMAQPFECNCGTGAGKCLGTVKGAKYLEDDLLKKYRLNKHIIDLVAERSAGKC